MSAAAEKALGELMEISSQVQVAALCDRKTGGGTSTLTDEEHAKRFVAAAKRLLETAETVRGEGDTAVTQLEVATSEGSVFLVRDGEQIAAAVTGPAATAGLVFYDLKSCLRSAAEKPKRRRAAKKAKSDA